MTETRPTLLIIVASTRPGRVGLPVAEWFEARALGQGDFDIDLADLKEIDLPFFDEPKHPRLQEYEHQHTKDWSARVAAADAVVIVTPEYNFGFSAPLKNALDFLSLEWNYKPVGFVSYGGVSAGTRSVQMIKQVVTTLKMFPLFENVAIPFVSQFIGEGGALVPNDVMENAADAMLAELRRVSDAMAPLRS
jgi:NAD(P)H-dependent FMN reductase